MKIWVRIFIYSMLIIFGNVLLWLWTNDLSANCPKKSALSIECIKLAPTQSRVWIWIILLFMIAALCFERKFPMKFEQTIDNIIRKTEAIITQNESINQSISALSNLWKSVLDKETSTHHLETTINEFASKQIALWKIKEAKEILNLKGE